MFLAWFSTHNKVYIKGKSFCYTLLPQSDNYYYFILEYS